MCSFYKRKLQIGVFTPTSLYVFILLWFFCKKSALCNLERCFCQKEDIHAKKLAFKVENNRIIRVYVLKSLILEEWDGQHNEYNEAVLSWEATPIIRNLSVI